jgi:hypothetical protein
MRFNPTTTFSLLLHHSFTDFYSITPSLPVHLFMHERKRMIVSQFRPISGQVGVLQDQNAFYAQKHINPHIRIV